MRKNVISRKWAPGAGTMSRLQVRRAGGTTSRRTWLYLELLRKQAGVARTLRTIALAGGLPTPRVEGVSVIHHLDDDLTI